MRKVQFEPNKAGPLDGVLVLDLSRLVAGNMLTLQLADFGAEVLKIEDMTNGDPLRDWREDGLSLHWKIYGRNKKSVALNLRDPKGRELLLDLVAKADVLVENFRPGTLEKMGLAPPVLLERQPGLVIVRISGFGQDGPYSYRPGFGTIVEGMSGFAAKNGYPDRPPVLPPMALADMVAGLYGASSVLVALREREVRGGAGQVIDLPLLDSIISILGADIPTYRLNGKLPKRTGSRSPVAGPRNVFETKDGRWISISAPMQQMSERLFRAIGRPDMVDDPRFKTNDARMRNADACDAPIAAFVRDRMLDDALAHFEAADITAAPVYGPDQLLSDPHVQARDIIVDVPDEDMGSVPVHNVIPRLSRTPGGLRRPAPRLGEHTSEILRGLGYDAAAVSRLAGDGVVLVDKAATP